VVTSRVVLWYIILTPAQNPKYNINEAIAALQISNVTAPITTLASAKQ